MAAPLLTIVPSVLTFFGEILGVLDGDKKAKAEAIMYELETARSSMEKQLEINREEAKHTSIFVAGWRPAFGWLGVFSCAVEWVIRPLLPIFWHDAPALPSLPNDMMWVILTGILGIGGLRSVEKSKGVQGRH